MYLAMETKMKVSNCAYYLQVWHKSKTGLFRTPEEIGPMSPHIVFIEERDRFSFEVHAELKPFFTGLNFHEAIASFLHLAFVGNLQYPENGEAVAVWLQRKVACINDPGKKMVIRKEHVSFFLFQYIFPFKVDLLHGIIFIGLQIQSISPKTVASVLKKILSCSQGGNYANLSRFWTGYNL